jgi:hypothetical protein
MKMLELQKENVKRIPNIYELINLNFNLKNKIYSNIINKQ